MHKRMFAHVATAVEDNKFADIAKAAGDREALLALGVDATEEVMSIREMLPVQYGWLDAATRGLGAEGTDTVLNLLTATNLLLAVALRRQTLVSQALSRI